MEVKRSSHVEILITLFSSLLLLVLWRWCFSSFFSNVKRCLSMKAVRIFLNVLQENYVKCFWRDSFCETMIEVSTWSSEIMNNLTIFRLCNNLLFSTLFMFSSAVHPKQIFMPKEYKQLFKSPRIQRKDFPKNCWFCLQFLYAITINLYGTQLYHKTNIFLFIF